MKISQQYSAHNLLLYTNKTFSAFTFFSILNKIKRKFICIVVNLVIIIKCSEFIILSVWLEDFPRLNCTTRAGASTWAAWATTFGIPQPRLDCTTAGAASTGVTAGVTTSTTFGLPRQRPPRTTISRITLTRPRSSSPLRLPPRLPV